jgi:hypothetical protein
MTPFATFTTVIPAKAGIHRAASSGGEMDFRLRGNDEKFRSAVPTQSCLLSE